MKYVIKRNSLDYIINCDSEGSGGYNVVPRAIDPFNKYTINEVETYLTEHPEMLLDSESINLKKLTRQAKARRDELIQKVVWRIQRHESEIRQGVDVTEPIGPLDAYIQALRDLPLQEGFPESIIWPEEPNG